MSKCLYTTARLYFTRNQLFQNTKTCPFHSLQSNFQKLLQPQHRNVQKHFCHSTDNKTSDSQITNPGPRLDKPSTYLDSSDPETFKVLSQNMLVIVDFISEEEEKSLFEEAQNAVKRLKYEGSHWDDAIHGYRETEKREWSEENTAVLSRVRRIAFDSADKPMTHVHVLDIEKTGYIKPHVDSVRFCGDVITGLSLLSPSVMRLVHEKDSSKYTDCMLQQRSLYIMKNEARYDYTHEILKSSDSRFRGYPVPRNRRISVICRCEANPDRQVPDT